MLDRPPKIGIRTLLGAAAPLALAFGAAAELPVAFEKIALPTAQGAEITSLAIGPDGRLYGAVLDGEIRRWPLLADGTTGALEILDSLRAAEGGDRLLIGLVFDPASTPANPIAWVTHTSYGFGEMPDWGGKISRLSGPSLATVDSFAVGLPRSSRDHVTNGIAFGPDGALYLLQGSNSAMGAPDLLWSERPERLLSAAVLRFDPALVSSPPLDAKTEDGGSYDPFAPGAPLTIYASGVRNAYDLLWHTNGELYVPTNGSAFGGNTPAGAAGAPCAGGGSYPGPAVPALGSVAAQRDFLFRVLAGAYYGHPNPLLCHFVLNGGNPSAGADAAEVTQYPIGTLPDPAHGGFSHDFGLHRSPDGILEYRSDRFGAALQGKLLVARYSQGDDILVLTPGALDPDIESALSGLPGLTGFSDPLDLVEDPETGRIYVSEFGAARVTLLDPLVPAVPALGPWAGAAAFLLLACAGTAVAQRQA